MIWWQSASVHSEKFSVDNNTGVQAQKSLHLIPFEQTQSRRLGHIMGFFLRQLSESRGVLSHSCVPAPVSASILFQGLLDSTGTIQHLYTEIQGSKLIKQTEKTG